MKKYSDILFSIFLFVLTTSTYAYEKGEVLLRTGMALMEPNASSEPLVVSSPSAGLAPLSLDSFLGTETGLGVQNSMAIAGNHPEKQKRLLIHCLI